MNRSLSFPSPLTPLAGVPGRGEPLCFAIARQILAALSLAGEKGPKRGYPAFHRRETGTASFPNLCELRKNTGWDRSIHPTNSPYWTIRYHAKRVISSKAGCPRLHKAGCPRLHGSRDPVLPVQVTVDATTGLSIGGHRALDRSRFMRVYNLADGPPDFMKAAEYFTSQGLEITITIDSLLNQPGRHWEQEFETLSTLLAHSAMVHADEPKN